ncbi:hypothetical protein ACHAP5_010470 [Fusarium lateritium]
MDVVENARSWNLQCIEVGETSVKGLLATGFVFLTSCSGSHLAPLAHWQYRFFSHSRSTCHRVPRSRPRRYFDSYPLPSSPYQTIQSVAPGGQDAAKNTDSKTESAPKLIPQKPAEEEITPEKKGDVVASFEESAVEKKPDQADFFLILCDNY